MARIQKYKHSTQITGTDNPAKQVSKNVWNEDPSQDGMEGNLLSVKTLATDALTPTATLTEVNAETGVADDFSQIINTETSDKDILKFIAASGDTITVKHGVNNIFLRNDADKILSETQPLILRRIGTNWYEVVGPELIAVTVSGSSSTVEVFDF